MHSTVVSLFFASLIVKILQQAIVLPTFVAVFSCSYHILIVSYQTYLILVYTDRSTHIGYRQKMDKIREQKVMKIVSNVET